MCSLCIKRDSGREGEFSIMIYIYSSGSYYIDVCKGEFNVYLIHICSRVTLGKRWVKEVWDRCVGFCFALAVNIVED